MMRRFALSLAVGALAWSQQTFALGLGEIRLSSALNEPLSAEIELLSVTQEELRSLTVGLAPTATFDRYGLDRPAFLSQISFEVESRNGTGVVIVTSPGPITEPFVTLLVEAVWPSGRLLREYTVLLDPPIFATPEPTQPPPSASASARPSSSSSTNVRRPATRAQPTTPAYDGSTYTIQRGDTLWEIAERVRPSSDVSINQVMLSLYDANPAAFNGNINRISAGATLRIPDSATMRGRNATTALTEVRRQNAEWRGGQPNGSLRLVPPDDNSTAASTSTGSEADATSATGGSSSFAVNRLEEELQEKERLLALRDQELADLQARLAAIETGDGEVPALDSETQPLGTDPEPQGDDGSSSDDAEQEIFVDNELDEDPAATDSETVAETEDEPASAEPEQRPTQVVARPEKESFMDQALGLLSGIWGMIIGGVLALLALLFILAKIRNRGDDDSTGTWEALDDFEDDDDESLAATSRLRALAAEDESIVVVEADKGSTTAQLDEAVVPPAQDKPYNVEDTFSSETAINLDQSDPIAEADFHMAYGLYDQAADLINGAIQADPERRDLKEKLAEVYFVWGNQDGFVGVAEQLQPEDEDGDEGWEKIRIMGQQIAPEHALFAASAAAAPLESVDLDFAAETGSGPGPDIDFSTVAGGSAELSASGDDGGLDFEFSATGTDIVAGDEIDLDTGDIFQAQDDGSTVERPPETGDTVEQVRDEPTVEQPMVGGETAETPTIESAALPEDENTSEMPALQPNKAGDMTAEIELDDLGLDLDGLEDAADASSILEIPDGGELDIDSSIETLGIDGDALDQIGGSDAATGDSVTVLAPSSDDDDIVDPASETLLAPVDMEDSLIASANDDTMFADTGDATGRVPVIKDEDVDLDIGDLTAALQKSDFEDPNDETIERPLESAHASDLEKDVFAESLSDDNPLDLDIGTSVLDEDDAPTATRENSSPGEPDNRTMTEVGTKLDLARAYIDMGDPEGARSILNEVADEGSSEQQQEARKLLDDLPN